jgi:glycosyltransferase involved in cell wall biosynthesis
VTTFIDFRYARTLSSALLAGYQPEDPELTFDTGKENYIALEFPPALYPRKLLDLASKDGRVVASIGVESDRSLSLRIGDGEILLKTPAGVLGDAKENIIGFCLNTKVVGFKLQQTKFEKKASLLNGNGKLFLKLEEDKGAVSILGRESGRAEQWARLYYDHSKKGKDSLGVELVFDWHHLRSGIPLNGTLTAEKLIEWTDFRLRFHSYVLDEKEARDTDFVKLFSTPGTPDISLHITPPLYTHFNPGKPNIGLFVCESKNVIPSIVSRCNLMDSIIVPSAFVSEAFKENGVHRPIHVIPHGVDLEFYRPVSKRTPLSGGRGFNFLAISTHLERKNIRHLVRAFLEEFHENEDVALFLLVRPEFGTTQNNVIHEFDKWEKRYFRKSAPILLSTGYITRGTLRDFYSNADVYVMPSNEGFGLTLLEAMASGTPVIGLKYGGILDFVNDKNGYLIPKGPSFVSKDIDSIAYVGDRFFEPDVMKLRAVMRHVFENRQEAYQKGLLGRNDCEKYYSWDRTAIEISKIIEETYSKSQKGSTYNLATKCLKPLSNSLSWVLCVPDDISIAESLPHLRKKKTPNNDILCLFTRYARFKDIMLARKNGFLFHRWDGSISNCNAIVRSVILNPWVGILYPGEKIEGQLTNLVAFLEAQPKEVCEVLVPCSSGINEPRFIRSQPLTANPEHRIFKEITVCS